MVRLNVTRVGFLMGVSLLLAAIVYFFAANWDGLGRADKILLSAGLIVLFYGASFLFAKLKGMPQHFSFLSSLLLVAGCISFGASAALVNQVYHSHADTFEIFLVWSIPALLLALLTRYSPFYVLAYALVHLTLWQLFFPTSLSVVHTEEQLLGIGALFALLNALVLVAAHSRWLQSAVLRLLAFVGLQVALLAMTALFETSKYDILSNIASLAAIALSFFFYYRIRLNVTMLTFTGLAASAYAVIRYLELLDEHSSTEFYIGGLLFVAALLTANVFFFRFLNSIHSGEDEEDKETDAVREKDTDERKKGALSGKIVSSIVIIVGVLIGSASLIGLVLTLDLGGEPEYLLYAISLIMLLAAILLPKLNPAIRYTVLTVGFAAGLVSIAWIDSVLLSLLLMAIAVFGWLWLDGRAQHLFIYSLLNINAAILLFQLLDSLPHDSAYIVLTLAVLHTLVYTAQHWLQDSKRRQHLREAGLFYMLLFLLWLTFMEDIFPHSGIWFSLINFVVVTALAFHFINRNKGWEAGISLAFWFVYIGVKYYDLLWTLMHKSITLALLGALFLGVTYAYAYRTRAASVPADQPGYKPWSGSGIIWLLIVILLQLGYLAWFTASSESLLAHGKQIKLQIEPLDPRSMLQGDYVRLNYSISTPPDKVREELERPRSTARVQVVVRPGIEADAYVFDRLHRGEPLADGEVVLNGRVSGWQTVYYGIETWFVPEGTGRDTEQSAKYAYVRVSARGDAVLERLSES